MSRTILIVVAVGCLLAATFVAPAMAAPPEIGSVALEPAGDRTGPDGQLAGRLAPIQPNGDCEGGGAGGCPIPG